MEAAVATIYSKPHLSLHNCNDIMEDDDGSSSSGELQRGDGGTTSSGGRSSSSSLRRRSYGDVAIRPIGGAGGALIPHSGKPTPRYMNGGVETTNQHAAEPNIHVWTTDEHAAEAYFHVSAVPGYVSMEDVIGNAALYRDGSGRPLAAAIGDPLLRKTSRLYAREDGRRGPHHRRQRQQSPGPLGTCRGSVMHAIVKKYVHPLQDFLARIFCCKIPSDQRPKPTVLLQ